MGEWTLFSNHGHVLVCLAKNNEARLRDVAAEVGITERAVQNILRELQQSGLVAVSKHGRCNHYQINSRKHLRHPLESHCTVGKLLHLLIQEAGDQVVQAPDPVPATKQAKPARSAPSAPPVAPPRPVEAEDRKIPASGRPEHSVTPGNRAAESDRKVTAVSPPGAGPSPDQASKNSPAPAKRAEDPVASMPKGNDQGSGEVTALAKPASKPAPAKSSKGAVKKDSKKTDNTPDSQQGSLF